ncbi:MAG: hypothetical protein WEC14_09415 [Chloroflexota bacterium]
MHGRGTRLADRRDAVVGVGGQVNDGRIRVRKGRRESVGRRDANRCAAGGLDRTSEAVGPDKVLGQDEDTRSLQG